MLFIFLFVLLSGKRKESGTICIYYFPYLCKFHLGRYLLTFKIAFSDKPLAVPLPTTAAYRVIKCRYKWVHRNRDSCQGFSQRRNCTIAQINYTNSHKCYKNNKRTFPLFYIDHYVFRLRSTLVSALVLFCFFFDVLWTWKIKYTSLRRKISVKNI